ncbi:hypothetical protein FBHYGVHD_CDS0088 [Staphylococcus phage MVC_VPHSA1]|uniref:Uncharacterized protein n=1 Tax=Staphylococcus phage MVC_VPHSA1 TaxID=3088876 RepID=A0ABZ0QZD2_9CAUD|nr:hypothetical protein FBHYGVHD_CDS0088 [Staphylococcus phage MVC_VPHSA1]
MSSCLVSIKQKRKQLVRKTKGCSTLAECNSCSSFDWWLCLTIKLSLCSSSSVRL